MNDRINNDDEILTCKNCITGFYQQVTLQHGVLVNISAPAISEGNFSFIAPGLTDLQVNGITGIDFNDPSLTVQDIVKATLYLLSKGITTFLPAVITNTDENIFKILRTISKACLSEPIVKECIAGIHLEGPFISPLEGARGAHEAHYAKAPDWDLLLRFQEAAGGKIKLITMAPEWEGSYPFITKCTDNGILVSIGHSMADSEQVSMAVSAGATLSTHLGNGVPLLLKRHPNIIWDQLAAEELYTCIIADGIHIPDSFIKVVIRNKGNATLLVSDATCFAGMPPGEYQTHIGGTVVLTNENRLSLKGNPEILAGAAFSLLENIGYLISKNIATLREAWQMASTNIATMLLKNNLSFHNENDFVIFNFTGKEIKVERVIKNGKTVYER